MSGFREESIRVRIQTISDLPDTASQLSELAQLTRQLIELNQQQSLAARTNALQQVTAIEGVTAALKEQQTTSKKTSDDSADGLKKIGNEYESLGKTVRNFQNLVATAFTINEVKNFVTDVIAAKTEVDNFKIALETMIGSKQRTAEIYTQLVELAKTTPFDLQTLETNVAKLKAYGVATQDLIPTLVNLGNVAAAVGQDKLPQITLAYGQIMNLGKLMGTETRQLIEAGIPIYDMLADSMGKAKDEVIKLASEHKIMATDVQKAFQVASESGGRFEDMMAKMSKTVGGEVSNLGDSFFVAKARIGDFFEGQIRTGTRYLSDLIDAVAGSESAIKRTISTVGAAVSAWVAARVALNLLTAQKLIDEGQTDKLTLSQRILTVSTESMAAANATAAGGIRALWAAFASNPLGALVTLISLAASAWMTYDAATQDVISSLGEQQLKLESEKSELNGIANSALNAAMGSKERAKAIESLIQKYPDYFSGLDKEKTTNEQLRSILDKVNLSYAQRISLAREAYQVEQLNAQQKTLLEREKELLEGLPEELKKIAGGSISQLLSEMADEDIRKLVNNQRNGIKELFSGTMEEEFKAVSNGLLKIEEARAKSAAKVMDITTSSNKAEVVAIKEHFEVQREQANGNSQKIQKINEDEKKALAELTKTSNANELKTLTAHQEKLKQVTLLSDNEIALIKKEGEADQEEDRIKQLKAQLDYLNKQEDAEIDHIKKVKVARTTSATELAALHEKARQQAIAIDQKYDAQRAEIIEQIEIEEQRRFLAKIQESNDKVAVLTAKRLEAEKMLVMLNDAQTSEERLAALRVYNDKYAENVKQAATETLKAQLDSSKKILDDLVAKNGERGDEYRKAYAQWLKDNEQYNTAILQQTTTSAKEVAQSIQKYENEIREAKQKTAELEKDTLEQQKQNRKELLTGLANLIGQQDSLMGQLAGGLISVYNGFDSLNLKALSSAQGLLKNANDTLTGIRMIYSDGSAEGAAKIAEAEKAVAGAQNKVEEVKGQSAGAVMAIMGAIQQVLTVVADAINSSIVGQYKVIAESLGKAREAYTEFFNYVRDISEEVYQREMETFTGTLDEKLAKLEQHYARQTEIAQGYDIINAEMQQAQKRAEIAYAMTTDFKRAKELIDDFEKMKREESDLRIIQQAELAQKKAKEVYETRLDYINRELEAFKTAKNEEIETLRQSEDIKKGFVETASNDQQLRLQNDDVFRADLLKKGEAREIKALDDAKSRELNRAKESGASAEELARIINAFEELKTKKHAEYADARGNKEKEVSLATTEVRAEEKDAVQSLEVDTANKIQVIMQQIADQEAKAADDRLKANAEFLRQTMMAENVKFQAQKNMMIASLRAQQAVLEGQKGFLKNNGAINAAIDAIGDSINQITAMQFDSGGVDISTIRSHFGTVTIEKQPVSNPWGIVPTPRGSLPGYTPPTTTPPTTTPTETGPGYPISGLGNPVTAAYDEKFNEITLTYDPSGHQFQAYDVRGNTIIVRYATGFAQATGKSYFKGTDWLELGEHKKGRDTIPLWANEGERILPTADNEAIGGKGLSNEKLVEKVKFADKFIEQFPQMRDLAMWSEIANTRFTLPAGVMNSSGGNQIDVAGILNKLDSLEGTIRNQKLLSISMDERGFSKSLTGTQSKTNYFNSILNR